MMRTAARQTSSMSGERHFDAGKRWVVKIGSSLVTGGGTGLAVDAVADWVDQIAQARRDGIGIVLVSSGAVVEGMARLGLRERPASIHLLQAAAAVGQMGLVQLYESNFQRHDMHTAQVLLTHEDLRNRERYINARSTLRSLLDLGVVPVVNENDTVTTEEIRFGDNDTLAGMVANLIEATTLLLLTDQAGLFDADPRQNPAAKLIREASARDEGLREVAGAGSALGRGGMVTKLSAARVADRSGASTVIAAGAEPDVITRLANGEVTGTLLRADRELVASRKRWLAGLPRKGRLVLDAGAVRVLLKGGGSLLAVGVTGQTGHFTRGELVACETEAGVEIACGLINYGWTESSQIMGQPSRAIESILGYVSDEELIHRDNLVLL
jgi:glutamate 5-kinase